MGHVCIYYGIFMFKAHVHCIVFVTILYYGMHLQFGAVINLFYLGNLLHQHKQWCSKVQLLFHQHQSELKISPWILIIYYVYVSFTPNFFFFKCRSEESGGGPLFVMHFFSRPWIICMDPDNGKVFIINKPLPYNPTQTALCILLYSGVSVVNNQQPVRKGSRRKV